MSYILDALRRAESERTRGQVPGLDAQALALAGDDERPARHRGATRVVGAAVALLGAAALVWWFTRGETPVPATPAVRPVAGPSVTPAAAPDAAQSVTPPVVAVAPPPPAPAPLPVPAPAPAPAPAAVATPAPSRAAPPTSPLAAAAPAGPPATASRDAAAVVPPAPPAAVPTTAPSRAAASTPPPPPVEPAAVRLADLPPQQRSELPPMAIGGAIYSDSAAARFILINGQVVREGETAAPGVKLERIGPRAALLRWRELRIEVPY